MALAPEFKSIMDETKLNEINHALEQIQLAKQEIAKAKLAKLDVRAQEDQLLATEQKLRDVKSAFYPGR